MVVQTTSRRSEHRLAILTTTGRAHIPNRIGSFGNRRPVSSTRVRSDYSHRWNQRQLLSMRNGLVYPTYARFSNGVACMAVACMTIVASAGNFGIVAGWLQFERARTVRLLGCALGYATGQSGLCIFEGYRESVFSVGTRNLPPQAGQARTRRLETLSSSVHVHSDGNENVFPLCDPLHLRPYRYPSWHLVQD